MRSASHGRPTSRCRVSTRRGVFPRSGFTLVELLVSISVFIILAVIALSAFRGNSKDKITAGARQVQAVFNGAKSRAAKSGEPRGVRLLLDPNDGRVVQALQYIGSASYHSGTVRVQVAPSDAAGSVGRIVCEEVDEWLDLQQQGLLGTTARIRIPADHTGRWYTMNSINATTGVGQLNQMPIGATWDDDPSWDTSVMGAVDTFQMQPRGARNTGVARTTAPSTYSNTLAIPYLLRLEPQPLANSTPVNLPPGVVIDLDGSRVPANWRRQEDANQNGSLNGGEDLDGNGQLDFSAYYAPNFPTGYLNGPTHLDIMFGPNGTATGDFAALGPIFLTIAHVGDVELSRTLRYVNGTTTNYPAIVPGDFQESFGMDVNDFPNKERRAVAFYPQTGNVFISLVNGTGVDADHIATDPFSYAYAGRDSK